MTEQIDKNALYYCRVKYLDIDEFVFQRQNTAIPLIPPYYNVEVYGNGRTNLFGYYAMGDRFLYVVNKGIPQKVCRIIEYSSSPITESKTHLELKNILEQYKEMKDRIKRLKRVML